MIEAKDGFHSGVKSQLFRHVFDMSIETKRLSLEYVSKSKPPEINMIYKTGQSHGLAMEANLNESRLLTQAVAAVPWLKLKLGKLGLTLPRKFGSK